MKSKVYKNDAKENVLILHRQYKTMCMVVTNAEKIREELHTQLLDWFMLFSTEHCTFFSDGKGSTWSGAAPRCTRYDDEPCCFDVCPYIGK